jgi:hypothetical protein
MTVFFESHQITIRRLRPAGAIKQAYSATYTAYGADVQPIEGPRINDVGGRIGKTYEAWIDSEIDIREGDQIDSGGVRFSVKAVSHYHGAGLLDHKHLILESAGNVG